MFDAGRSTFNVKDASAFLPAEFSRLTDSHRFVAPPQLSLIFFLFNCGKIDKKHKNFLTLSVRLVKTGGSLERKPLQL